MGDRSRRAVLGLGAAATATVALGAGRPAYGAGRPARFNLAGRDIRSIGAKRLHNTTVLQSFAFDERRGHIYALQVMQGGIRLSGESRTRTHAERQAAGDLCLNKLTMNGDHLGHMYLKGFGHGSAMAVEESAAGGAVLWTECDASPTSGYGRAVGRFRFAEGVVLHSSGRAVETYRPRPGSTSNTPAIDRGHGRLLLRYRTHGKHRYALYGLREFRAGRFRALTDFPQPGANLGLPFQGMTLHGDYAYQMLGSAYTPGERATSANARLFCIDLRTGKVVDETWSQTAYALSTSEPEGLAVFRGTAGPRLYMGFASGPAGNRKFSLYYKAWT